MEAVGLFDSKMRSFTQITFDFTNIWRKNVVSWLADIILHKWYFCKFYTIKYVEIIGKISIFVTSTRIWSNRDINI